MYSISGKQYQTQCPKCASVGRDTRKDNMTVYPDGHKHCHACQYHEFPKHYVSKKVEPYVPKSLRPADYTREVPAEALKWLLQYGLPWSYWQKSLGYSPKEQRLVFSVGSPLAFSIGRYVGKASEYDGVASPTVESRTGLAQSNADRGNHHHERHGAANKPVRKWFVWGDSHKHAEPIGAGSSIVLVEDLISAHKIGNSGYATGLPLFGTKVHPCHLYYLINDNRPVVLWLDKDQELNVKKQAWQLESVINRQVKVVISDNDPKSLSYEEIKNAI